MKSPLILLFTFVAATHAAIVTHQPADQSIGRKFPLDGSTFGGPVKVAVDPISGKIFVCDTLRNRVLRFSIGAAALTGTSAEAAIGQQGLESEAPGTGMAQMNRPSAIAFDAAGRLWVADEGNRRVLLFPSPATGGGMAATLQIGDGAYEMDADSLPSPSGIAVDAAGTLYVSDRIAHRVLRFSDAAGKAPGAAADGVLGQPGFHAAQAATSQSRLREPTGLAVTGTGANTVLFVADTGNYRVLRFSNAANAAPGAPASGALGTADFNSAPEFEPSPAGMFSPVGLCVLPQGWLLMVDSTGRIRGCTTPTSDTFPAEDIYWYVTASYEEAFPDVAQSRFSSIALDQSGRLRLSDDDSARVLRVVIPSLESPTSALITGALGYTKMNMTGTPRPVCTAVCPVSGKVFAADPANNRVLRYASLTQLTSAAAPEAVLGQPDFNSFERARTSTGMHAPSGLCVDAAGRLWVADTGNDRVLRFDNAASLPSGSPWHSKFGGINKVFKDGNKMVTYYGKADAFREPRAVACGANGRLWVADTANHRVLRFDNAAAKPQDAPADRLLGQNLYRPTNDHTGEPDFFTRPGHFPDEMNGPQGLWEDASGNLWVADTGNHRVLGYHFATLKVDGPDSTWFFGQSVASGHSPGMDSTGLTSPTAVVMDGTGRLYISDTGNNRVVWVDNAKGYYNVIAQFHGCVGQPSLTAAGAGALSTCFRQPVGLMVDLKDCLYVSDSANGRIQRFLTEAPHITLAYPHTDRFRLVFRSVPGVAYEIQTSTDLKTWTKSGAATGMTLVNNTLWVSPEKISSVAQRFYRVTVP